MPFCDVEKTLAVHNRLREKHGAPPLQWSAECGLYAQKCADENMKRSQIHHCFVETQSTGRKMGQAIYWSQDASKVTSSVAVQCFYDEVKDPGYDYSTPGYQPGTGQFTSLVWYNTTHVGMSRSKDGAYIVANYYPAGNINDAKHFQKNVLPLNTPFSMRPRNKVEAALFAQFDIVSKGRKAVPQEEVEALFDSLGNKRLANAVRDADKDGDGEINPIEFVMAMSHPSDSDGENNDLGRIIGFIQADADGDMKVDKQELQRYLTEKTGHSISKEQATEIMNRFDKDGDGNLDYGELSNLLVSGDADKSAPETLTSPRPGSEGVASPRCATAPAQEASKQEKVWGVQKRGPEPSQPSSANLGPVVFNAWDARVEGFLSDVPAHCAGVGISVKSCLESGGTAELTRTSNTINAKLMMGEVVGQVNWKW